MLLFLIITVKGDVFPLITQVEKHNDTEYWSNLLFEQLWPPTILIDSNINNYNFTNDYFTIFGILGSTYKNNIPVYCNISEFNRNYIKNIQDELKQYWTDFNDYHSLLRFVYYKYYSCLHNNNIFYNEYSYFNIGLNLRENYNLYNILKKYNIVPSNKIYKKSLIRNSIFSEIGVMPIITCDGNRNLKTIIICFDRNTEPIFCRTEFYGMGCEYDFIYYPLYNINNNLNNNATIF